MGLIFFHVGMLVVLVLLKDKYNVSLSFLISNNVVVNKLRLRFPHLFDRLAYFSGLAGAGGGAV